MKNITKEEIIELQKIIREYKDIDNALKENDTILNSIINKQNALMKRLEENENYENEFLNTLKIKYPNMRIEDLIKYIQ